MGKEILTLDEAATLLEISPRALREAAARGEVPSQKVAHRWRFSRFALHQWLSDQTINPYLHHAGTLALNPLWDEVQTIIKDKHMGQPQSDSQRHAPSSVK